jgi:hypothetical protein
MLQFCRAPLVLLPTFSHTLSPPPSPDLPGTNQRGAWDNSAGKNVNVRMVFHPWSCWLPPSQVTNQRILPANGGFNKPLKRGYFQISIYAITSGTGTIIFQTHPNHETSCVTNKESGSLHMTYFPDKAKPSFPCSGWFNAFKHQSIEVNKWVCRICKTLLRLDVQVAHHVIRQLRSTYNNEPHAMTRISSYNKLL